jgi:hypothetical protein
VDRQVDCEGEQVEGRRVKVPTTSDPLRAALRQERRLLLVFCLLFGALIGALYVNSRQAERLRRMEAEHAEDRRVIADMAERYNLALSTGVVRGSDTRSLREAVDAHYKDLEDKEGQ